MEVTCFNKECGEKMRRKNLQTHLNEKCYYRPYQCEHCGHKDTYTAITGEGNGYVLVAPGGHYSECPKYPLACPNRCGVTGIRRITMPDHHSSCPLEPLVCPNEGCGERMRRKNLQTHLQEECYYRPYECEHCGQKDTYTAITGEGNGYVLVAPGGHYSECSEYPVACPNRCGVTGIRRRAMPDHHSSCPLEPLVCPNEGCGERMRRKNLLTHLQEECYYRPYECEHCGHKDTYTAITGEMKYDKESEYSSSEEDVYTCSLDDDIQGHYSECPEYPLACPNRCGVTGIRRRAMPDHHSSCPRELLNCTNKGCGERVSRKDLQTHSQEKCYYRPYQCEHCGHKDTYKAITGKRKYSEVVKVGSIQSHYSECPEYPVACPNRCGVTGIRRRAMPDHHSSCPLEPLDCPFKDAGCTGKIARKDMQDHMTANQQKHMLLTFQSLQRCSQQMKQDLIDTKQELQGTKRDLQDTTQELQDTKKELQDTKQDLQDTKQELQSTKRYLCATKQDLHNVLQSVNGLCKAGDTLTFRVRDFPQLRKEKKAWHSPPFVIGDKVRVRLAVYPSGVGRGQGSHVSVSLILMEVVQKVENVRLQCNVSITATEQHRSTTPKTLELCTHNNSRYSLYVPQCSARFPFPSPGDVLQSEELLLEIGNDAMTLELKLLEHHCHRW